MNKKALISGIYRAGNMSAKVKNISISTSNNSLVLITAAGQITGIPLQVSDDSDLEKLLTDTLFTATAKAIANLTEDDSFILLKDAVLKTADYDISYRYLYVFTDDIIAATITNSDAD